MQLGNRFCVAPGRGLMAFVIGYLGLTPRAIVVSPHSGLNVSPHSGLNVSPLAG
jgi:hypothetical protein